MNDHHIAIAIVDFVNSPHSFYYVAAGALVFGLACGWVYTKFFMLRSPDFQARMRAWQERLQRKKELVRRPDEPRPER